LHVLPGLAAELGERRRAAVGADVARDPADLLVGNVQAVLAPEGEQQVVAGDAGDLFGLERLQTPDAVVLVNDVVARAEIGKALQRAPEPRVRSRWTLAEDLRVREQDEPELAPDEAAPGRRDRKQELGLLGQRLHRLEQPRVEPAEQVVRQQHIPSVWDCSYNELTGATQLAEIVVLSNV